MSKMIFFFNLKTLRNEKSDLQNVIDFTLFSNHIFHTNNITWKQKNQVAKHHGLGQYWLIYKKREIFPPSDRILCK